MIIRCGRCGREYEIEMGEKAKDFQCECGGSLNQKRTIKDIRNQQQTHSENKQKDKGISYENLNLSVEGQKKDLYNRGYTLIDENGDEYIFKKDKCVLPLWLVAVITICLFPIGLLLGPLLYYFWRKPKIIIVKKDIKKDNTNREVIPSH